jgi:putative sigma-54 modulation protein
MVQQFKHNTQAMRVQVNAVHFDADAKLVGFIQKKLAKLETFYDKLISGEVYLKLDKGETSSKIHTKILEVKITMPGGEVFVKETGKTFEEATDVALEALKIQIKKFKDRKLDKGHIKQVAASIDAEDEDED